MEALKEMPENVGHSMGSDNTPPVIHQATNWTDGRKAFLTDVHNQEKEELEQGFNPVTAQMLEEAILGQEWED